MVSEICRAQNPLRCRYHGSLMRMYQAQATGNGDDYLYYRDIVQELKAQNWDEAAAFPESGEPKVGAEAALNRADADLADRPIPTIKRMVGREVVEKAADPLDEPLPTTMKRMVNRQVVEEPIPEATMQRMREKRQRDLAARDAQRAAAITGGAASSPVTVNAISIPSSTDKIMQERNTLVDVLDAPVYEINEKGRRTGEPKTLRFYQRKEGVTPAEPTHIRVQTNRELTPEEGRALSGLLGYAYKVRVGGSRIGSPQRDTPYSFIVKADTSLANEKNSGENLPGALDKFENTFHTYLAEGGSPVRKDTTRLIPVPASLNDVNLRFFYDSVIIDTPKQA